MVVAHHCGSEWSEALNPGAAAVWLFYVLSGFLVTGILVRARDAAGGDPRALRRAWASFAARRLLRLTPVYYAMLAAAVALDLEGARTMLVPCLTYTTNAAIAW